MQLLCLCSHGTEVNNVNSRWETLYGELKEIDLLNLLVKILFFSQRYIVEAIYDSSIFNYLYHMPRKEL